MSAYRRHVIRRRQYRAMAVQETMKKTRITTIFRFGGLP